MPRSLINPYTVPTLRHFLATARAKIYPRYDDTTPFAFYRDLHPATRDREALARWLDYRWGVYERIVSEEPDSRQAQALLERCLIHGNMARFLHERLRGYEHLYDYVYPNSAYEWVADAFMMARNTEVEPMLDGITDLLTWGLFTLLHFDQWSDDFIEDLLKDRYVPFLVLMINTTTDILGDKNF